MPEESLPQESVSNVGPGVRVVKKGERKTYVVCKGSSMLNSQCKINDRCVYYCSDGSEVMEGFN